MILQIADISSLVAQKIIVDSLSQYGFAIIRHNINQTLIDKVYTEWSIFFDSDEKKYFSFDNETQDGYVSQDQSETAQGANEKDLKEFYHFHTWGQHPNHTKISSMLLFDELFNLSNLIMSWISEKEILCRNASILRPIYYPASIKSIRASEHTDINMLTLLLATEEKGLQMLIDDEWVDAPLDQSLMIINSGDMLNSFGNFPSGIHRVVGSHKSRISLPFFAHAFDGFKISDLMTAKMFKEQRLVEIGLKQEL